MPIRIPMRLERRGGRKLIIIRKDYAGTAEADARRDADQGAAPRAPLAA